jgi:SNF2 family DNA or RNA helicase
MEVRIRPYQMDGLNFLVNRPRAALFDEPGLGKSMQALLAMRDLVPAPGRVLIVAPGDAVGVWKDEVAFWLSEESATFYGPRADPSALVSQGVVITNYHRLATVFERHWDGVIFDESQMLRNRKTRTLFVTVRSAFDQQRRGLGKVPVFFLSGTPIVKAAGDLWPILHLIDRQRWSSYWRFVQTYSVTWQDQFGWHVEGVTNAKGLWDEVSSVALRRTVAEVQPSLPPKVRQRVPLTMTARQAKAYREMERDMIAEIDNGDGVLLAPSVLARETRLRQLLACPRLVGVDDDGAALDALAEVAASHNRPFVVFTPFAEAIPYVQARLEAAGRTVYTVRGGMGERFRESVAGFKVSASLKDEPAPVLVATVQMGKSWSVAEVTHEVYFLEYDWNVTTQVQAESRLHRNEQTDTVFARYLVHEKSHDFDALDILAGKKRLADVILDRARR